MDFDTPLINQSTTLILPASPPLLALPAHGWLVDSATASSGRRRHVISFIIDAIIIVTLNVHAHLNIHLAIYRIDITIALAIIRRHPSVIGTLRLKAYLGGFFRPSAIRSALFSENYSGYRTQLAFSWSYLFTHALGTGRADQREAGIRRVSPLRPLCSQRIIQ